jgi:toxin ParE1/3/4
LVEAARFYENAVIGLGSQFLGEFDWSIAQILASPSGWRLVKGDKRRFLMRRFPYGIYYRIVGPEVRILVVRHHRQHPEYGFGRI